VGVYQEVNMSVISLVPVSLCFSLLSFIAAQAMAAEELDNIVVSATRSEAILQNMPIVVTVITAGDIARSGAIHLVDILRSHGGLAISDLFGDGTDASVGLRGFSSTSQQNTLIMIDGRRLNNADNGLPDLNTVALRNIEQIEIVKGSLGTLYGDKAVGGVINIITRKPESLAFQIQADYGSYENRSLFANLENRHDNGIAYRVSAQRRLSNNYRDNNALQLTDLSTRLAWAYSDGEVFLEYQGVDEDIEVPGPLFVDQLVTDRRQALNPEDAIETDTNAGRIGIQHTIIDGVDLLAEYTNRFSDTAGQLSSGGTPSLFVSKRQHMEFTPRLTGTFPAPAGEAIVTVGVDWFATDYLIRSDFGITDDTQRQQSVYARATVPLSARLAMTGGGRHGKVRNDILVDTLAFGRSLPEGTEIDDHATAWELGLSYKFTTDWRVFGKLDRNYRFVTADEYSAVADNNFFADLFAFGTVVPLPATQTGLSYEIGAEWQGTGRHISLQLYQLDIDDEIEFDPVLFLNTNIGATRRRGVMLEGSFTLTESVELAASYSYVDAELTSGRFDGADLTFIPDYSGSFSAHYRHDEHLSAYVEVVGVSDRVFGGDFANAFAELPGHVVGNLNLAYDYRQFRLSVRVNNLLDKGYSDSGNIGFDFRVPFPSPQAETYFPAPGRNLMLSVQYSYQ